MPYLQIFSEPKRLTFKFPPPGIETIAAVLGRICRFAGNTRVYWPVLMHSLPVAELVPGPLALHGLLHDAAEIFVGDIPAPVKHPAVKKLEEAALLYIYGHLGVQFPSPETRRLVKRADLRALRGEVWTVGPSCLRELREFRRRDFEAERFISEMVNNFSYEDVLEPDGKYVLRFVQLYNSSCGTEGSKRGAVLR